MSNFENMSILERCRDIESKSMTSAKRESAKSDLIGFYVGRPITYLATIPFLEANKSAMFASYISLIPVVAALVIFVFAQNVPLFVLGWFLIFVWSILDGVDGNIARYTGTSSKIGELWDATVGWMAMIVYYIGMGFAALRLPGIFEFDFLSSYYLALGCLTALLWVFPKLVMHKKINLMGKESVSNIQERVGYSIPKLIVFNLTSYVGFGLFLFLLSIFMQMCDLYLICHFVLAIAMAVYSCASFLSVKGV